MYYLMFPCHKLSTLTGHRIAAKLPRHAGAIAAQEMLPESVYKNLFKFAIARNPWDLQVSSYYHVQKERPDMLVGVNSFKDYIRYKLDPERPFMYHIDITTKLQTDHILDLHGKRIVDFVGRYENLADDAEYIRQKIGLRKLVLPQKRVAKNRSRDYRSYYDDITAEAVAQHYAQDIQMLSYEF